MLAPFFCHYYKNQTCGNLQQFPNHHVRPEMFHEIILAKKGAQILTRRGRFYKHKKKKGNAYNVAAKKKGRS